MYADSVLAIDIFLKWCNERACFVSIEIEFFVWSQGVEYVLKCLLNYSLRRVLSYFELDLWSRKS
jgi:hypothetical protein